MPRERILSPNVKEGPAYSQAMKAGDLLFLSGQVSTDPDGNIVGVGDVEAQTRQVLANMKALIEAAGATLDDIVKLTVYVVDINDGAKVRAVRQEFFGGPEFPASTLVGDIKLALPEFLVEIEAVVTLK